MHEVRSPNLEARHRGSNCGAVSYFKSGRTILKVRQLRCWRGSRGRIGVISHSPPLGQLHPRSLQSYFCFFSSSYLSPLAESAALHALSQFPIRRHGYEIQRAPHEKSTDHQPSSPSSNATLLRRYILVYS